MDKYNKYDQDTIRLEKFLKILNSSTMIKQDKVEIRLSNKLTNTLKGVSIRYFDLYDEVKEIYPSNGIVSYILPEGVERDNKHVAFVILDLEDIYIAFACSKRYDDHKKKISSGFVFRCVVKDNIDDYLNNQLSSTLSKLMAL